MTRLSKIEIEALLAAAGNVDPCMFEEDDSKEGDRLYDAWLSGQEQLRQMLARREARQRNRSSAGKVMAGDAGRDKEPGDADGGKPRPFAKAHACQNADQPERADDQHDNAGEQASHHPYRHALSAAEQAPAPRHAER